MNIERRAHFSGDGRYRYMLYRGWSKRPPLCMIMLNPSIATAEVDDPTVIRQMRRAKRWRHGSLTIVNIGAGIATNPVDWMIMEDPIGPENWTYITGALRYNRRMKGMVIAAWGNHAPLGEQQKVVLLAKREGIPLYHLGLTKRGYPMHPLYVSYEKKPIRWDQRYGHNPQEGAASLLRETAGGLPPL